MNATYNDKDEKGLEYIISILGKLDCWLKEFSIEKKHQIIYRGITSIHEADIIRSGASIRLEATYSPKYSYSEYIAYHKNLIRQVKNSYPETYKNWNDLEVLADLQHNGAATCLVDFSKNVLVSLWFACNDSNDSKKKRKKSNKSDADIDKENVIIAECTYENENIRSVEGYGVLYCYNITYDMVYENKLSYITNRDINKNIEDILVQTKKITNFCSNTEYAFLLWEPALLNNRILRQDSVFLFGLNRFYIKNHHILQIKIHDSIKKSILDALNRFFNISATTIFNDKQGFATVNDKNKHISNRYLREDLYEFGLSKMFAGDYKMALDFFTEREVEKNYAIVHFDDIDTIKENTNSKISIDDAIDRGELYLSKAICYKNLYDYESHDRIILEYRKAMKMFLVVLNDIPQKIKESEINDKEKESYMRKYKRYSRKLLRVYNDVINLLYDIEDYLECISFCNSAIKNINEIKNGEKSINEIKQFHLDENYTSVYCNIAIMELIIMLLLRKDYNSSDKNATAEGAKGNIGDIKNNNTYKGNNEIECLINTWISNIKDVEKNISDYQPFDRLMVSFMKLIYTYVFKVKDIKSVYESIKSNSGEERNDDDIDSHKREFIAEMNRFENMIKNNSDMNTFKDYSTWEFIDIITAIKECTFDMDDKKELLHWVAEIIQIKEWFEIRNLNGNSENA